MVNKKKNVRKEPSLSLEAGNDEFDLLREAVLLARAKQKHAEDNLKFYRSEFRRFQRVRKALLPLLKSLQSDTPGCRGCVDGHYGHDHHPTDRLSVLGRHVLDARRELLNSLPHPLKLLK